MGSEQDLEPVNLLDMYGTRRMRSWASGNSAHWEYRKVTYGKCALGWFVERIAETGSGAWLVSDESAARQVVDQWITEVGGEWRPTPAAWNGWQMPDDGLPWYQVGNQWLPGLRPEGHTGRYVTGTEREEGSRWRVGR